MGHLLAAADELSPGRWGAHIALCGAELRTPSSTAVADEDSEWSTEGERYCPECVREAQRWVGEASPSGEGGRPSWCSRGHCYLSEGVRVHVQRPVRWQDDTAELELTSGLVHPQEDDRTYVELTNHA